MKKKILENEIINVNNSMTGQAISHNSENQYNYKNTYVTIWQTADSTEELETIEIIENLEYTENKLRKEQGLNERIKY